jgi:hypothetical protein
MKEQESESGMIRQKEDAFRLYESKLASLLNQIRDIQHFEYDLSFDSSFGSLPTDILLDCMTDLSLVLKDHFDQGTRGARLNTGLRFEEHSTFDLKDKNAPFKEFNPAMALHSQKSIKIFYPSKYYLDPLAANIFSQLAISFQALKRQEPVRKVFMTFLDYSGLLKRHPPRKNVAEKKNSQYHWWRRQQRRFRRRTGSHNP